jgi:GTP-binding protein
VGDEEAGEVLAELLRPGDRALLLAGGRGGRGNTSFKSGINNAPLIAENGEEGEEAWFELELKVVADVGIVGVPNAGKSTLLSAISNARPKIANYRFTTLVPNLGVVETDFDTTVFADVPGLLEGAHAGVGLGKEFLRHCERCRVLVHVLDGTSEDPLGDYDAVNAELALFNPAMADKPQVVVFNKMDTLEAQVQWEELIEAGAFEQRLRGGERPLPVSAAARQGHAAAVKAAKAALRTLDEGGDADAAAAGDDAGEGWADEWDTSVPFNPMADVQPAARHRVEQRPRRAAESAEVSDFTVEESARGVWRVRGAALERFVQMTNWDYYESAKRFQAVMGAAGVYSKLRKMGAKEGDTVALGEFEFDWEEDDNKDLRGNMGEFTEKRVGRGSKRWPAQIRD